MKGNTFESGYYEAVEAYYDADAVDFESRYWQNPILRRIRQSFREEVKRHEFSTALEIGYGPGFDLVHFARVFPEKQWFGVDISPQMQRIASEKIGKERLGNARVEVGSVADVPKRFPNQQFDMIFVFFGALNTVKDLEQVAQSLDELLAPNGKMVITFVNKWFLQGILVELLKGKFVSAFSRLRTIWGGYSPTKHLDSKCYSNRRVKRTFRNFKVLDFRGYSIFYPAWYYQRLASKIPKRLMPILWQLDERIGATRLGYFGEYTRYTFVKKSQHG